MFIDRAEIYVRSGMGGNGVLHFRREKYVPFGGPDGGDGGKGGDVVLEVDPKINTLSAFRQKTKLHAENGQNGGKQNMTGRSGKNLIIQVPPGTVVYEQTSGDLLGDLVEPGQRLTIVKGGRGGKGNTHFASSRNQAPRIAEKGEPAQERNLRLELKLIADIGIVGVPNAGKSTFLAAVTNAKPKIASYPFTTLEPNLGVAELDDETILVLADIPGLIEGAHNGLGLGHEFLRHIQRTRVLIHLLDGMAEDPILDYRQILSELTLFDPDLGKKPQVVALNKMDLLEVQERWEDINQRLVVECGIEKSYAVSAVEGRGVRDVLYRAAQLLKELPEVPITVDIPVYSLGNDPRKFIITRTPGGWRVTGEAIERVAAMTYWEHSQSVRRFQRILQALGIVAALRDAGVNNGETVVIGDYELEWSD